MTLIEGRPTIDDVARAADVSVATVSRALRGLPNVAPATRDRVVAAAAELSYEVDPKASGLATGTTMTVGLVAPMFGLWYADRVVCGAETVFADAGYDMLVASVRDDADLERFYKRARGFGRRIDGALLIDLYLGDQEATSLGNLGVPIVAVGNGVGADTTVAIDDEAAAEAATSHLIEMGHERIGLVGGAQKDVPTSLVPTWRRAGWVAGLEAAGLSAPDRFVADGDFSIAGGGRGAGLLLDLPEPPTALFCMSDAMALGALLEARRRRLDVPADLSIIGFDDDDIAEPFGLTTVRQPVAQLGVDAASLLLEGLAASSMPPSRVHPVELVVRATTAGPR